MAVEGLLVDSAVDEEANDVDDLQGSEISESLLRAGDCPIGDTGSGESVGARKGARI